MLTENTILNTQAKRTHNYAHKIKCLTHQRDSMCRTHDLTATNTHTHTQDNNTAKAAITIICTHIGHSQLFNSYIRTPKQPADTKQGQPSSIEQGKHCFHQIHQVEIVN